MAGTGVAVVLDPPPLTPPPNGLLNTAPIIEQTDNRWINGIQFQPEPCDNATVFDPCSSSGDVSLAFTDGVTTITSTSLTSATAAFSADDVGKLLTSAKTANAVLADGVTTIFSGNLTSANAAFTSDDVGKVLISTKTANSAQTDGVSTVSSATFTSATAAFNADDAGKTVTSTKTANASFADGVTNTDTSLVSATAAFSADDVGKTVTGTGILVSTTIASVTNSTTVVLSAPTTATATGVTITIVSRKVLVTGATISSVTNGTTVVLSVAAKSTATAVDFTIVSRKVLATGTTIASLTNATTVVLSVNARATATTVDFTIVARKVLVSGTTIASVTNGTTVVLSPAAQSTAATVDFTIVSRNLAPNRRPKIALQPFGVQTEDTCSAFGFERSDYEARARRALAARETKAVETEFELGAIISTNLHLQDAVNTTILNSGTAYGLRAGLAALLNAISTYNLGRGMIHARAGLVEMWAANQMLQLTNGKLYTWTGTLVVPGSGYSGASPSAVAPTPTAEWAYATDVLQIIRGPVEVFVPEPIDANNLDRINNTVTIRAQRMYSAMFNACAVIAAKIDTTSAA